MRTSVNISFISILKMLDLYWYTSPSACKFSSVFVLCAFFPCFATGTSLEAGASAIVTSGESPVPCNESAEVRLRFGEVVMVGGDLRFGRTCRASWKKKFSKFWRAAALGDKKCLSA